MTSRTQAAIVRLALLLGAASPAMAGSISVQARLANHEPFAGAVVTVSSAATHAPLAPVSAIVD